MRIFEYFYKNNFFSTKNLPLYFSPAEDSVTAFSCALSAIFRQTRQENQSPVILCIGTDKITGDCLGPLTGSKLRECGCPVPVFGTLEYPVHAVNLSTILSEIHEDFHNPYLLVVDASVGKKEHTGCVTLSTEPLYPGEGIHRRLPPVGDLSVTGIVSEASSHCAANLPYTRLYMVNRLAEYISKAMMKTLSC